MGNLTFKVYQIYYDTHSHQSIDSNFTAYNNSGTPTKGYENDVIIDVWINRRKEWIDVDYVGVLSWRFKEKTKLTGFDLFKRVSKINEGVISIMPNGAYKTSQHPYSRMNYKNIIKLTQLVDKAEIFDFKLFCYPIKSNIWCNYWIASPAIFDLYCTNYLNKVMTLFEKTKDAELLKALELTEKHRGKEYSVVTFFLEGLFSVFLQHENIEKYQIN